MLNLILVAIVVAACVYAIVRKHTPLSPSATSGFTTDVDPGDENDTPKSTDPRAY